MEDIFWKYKKHKLTQNASIIAASLFLALGVNMQLSWWDFSRYLKANVLESQVEQQKSDLYLEYREDTLFIKTHAPILNLKQIQFSLLYNNKTLSTDNIDYNIDNYFINYNYIDSWIINLQFSGDGSYSLQAWETIASMKVLKNTNAVEYINILNANFSDNTGKTYLMTMSGIEL